MEKIKATKITMAQKWNDFESNLIQSIDELLEDNSDQSIVHFENDEIVKPREVWPRSRSYYKKGNSILVCNKNYVKWSTIDSDENRPKPTNEEVFPMVHPNAAAMNMVTTNLPTTLGLPTGLANAQMLAKQYQVLLMQQNLLTAAYQQNQLTAWNLMISSKVAMYKQQILRAAAINSIKNGSNKFGGNPMDSNQGNSSQPFYGLNFNHLI